VTIERRFLLITTTFVFMLGIAACTTAPPSIQSGPDAELSFDGLHKVDNSRADDAWAVPDFDISPYSSILPVNGGIEYREVAKRDSATRDQSTLRPYFIDDKARAEFEALVHEIFREELQKSERFRIVDEPGPDTLIVAGGLLNVTSYTPPNTTGSRTRFLLSAVGDATLVLEIRDSQSNRILARSVDRRAAEPIGDSFATTNSVTTNVEVKRLIRYWASGLREALDGFAK
jgi:hypothetical protein